MDLIARNELQEKPQATIAEMQAGFADCKTRFSALRYFAIAALIVASVSIYMLLDEFHAYSSDAGQHYALVRALMDLEGWGRPLATPNLGGLPFYPPLSHWMAAEVGKLLGSGLIGMTVVASASVGLFYLTMFVISFRIDWRAPVFASLITICFALLRGPVFGRMVVNNYFYAQAVGSAIAALVLLIALYKWRSWNGIALDFFVLVSGQIVACTHLMPAAQLLAAYCTILLVVAWTRSSWRHLGRLVVFTALSLALTALNPFAQNNYLIAQSGGGAHINFVGERITQIFLLVGGVAASIKLIQRTVKNEDAGMFLGCMGLSACGLAFLQMLLFWIGIGSDYAIAKHMFVLVAILIFVLAANLALRRAAPAEHQNFRKPATILVICSVLALLTTRIDMYPSILNLSKVLQFQTAVRELSSRVKNSDGRGMIALASKWPPNIPYGITIGDLKFPMQIAGLIMEHQPLPRDEVSIAFMPANDPSAPQTCVIHAFSNQIAVALDYACILEAEIKIGERRN
jgi:hypothetical protein